MNYYTFYTDRIGSKIYLKLFESKKLDCEFEYESEYEYIKKINKIEKMKEIQVVNDYDLIIDYMLNKNVGDLI